MDARRRIDWSEILGPDDAGSPIWREDPAHSDVVGLLLAFEDLFSLQDPDALLRRTVELALDPIGLVRAGVYVYDKGLDLMIGTWGTDLGRAVVDEHHSMFKADVQGRRVFARAASGEAHWTVVEDCPIIVNEARETRVVGRGWAVCTPIRSARGPIGMLYNDAGLTDAAVEPVKQARAAVLCTIVGLRLEGLQGSRGTSSSGLTARHPAVTRAARMLADDPSLTGEQIAAELQVSASRFARLFKAEMKQSLVGYRNHLRLERFSATVDARGTNLLEAALAAGFGSYAQFHRVFRAMRGVTPREYLVSVRRARERSRPPSPGSRRR